MKTKHNLYILMFLIGLFSCAFYLGIKYKTYKIAELEKSFSMNDTGLSIFDLKVKALQKGDTIAYWNLSTEYLDFSTEEFLPIALEMANKHNYPKAYFDVYSTIIQMDNLNEEHESLEEWEKLNPKMSRIALDYLLNGAKLGHFQSKETLKEYYLKNKKLNPILMNHKDLISEYSETINKLE